MAHFTFLIGLQILCFLYLVRAGNVKGQASGQLNLQGTGGISNWLSSISGGLSGQSSVTIRPPTTGSFAGDSIPEVPAPIVNSLIAKQNALEANFKRLERQLAQALQVASNEIASLQSDLLAAAAQIDANVRNAQRQINSTVQAGLSALLSAIGSGTSLGLSGNVAFNSSSSGMNRTSASGFGTVSGAGNLLGLEGIFSALFDGSASSNNLGGANAGLTSGIVGSAGGPARATYSPLSG